MKKKKATVAKALAKLTYQSAARGAGLASLFMFLLPMVNPPAATAFLVFAVVVVFLVAPVSHVNVEMSPGHRLKLRKCGWLAVSVAAVTALTLIWFLPGGTGSGIVLAVGLGVSSVSMLFAHCLKLVREKQAVL